MIAITGGGTGGHLVIAKAIKDELNSRGVQAIFIGSSNGQDKAWFENDESWEATYFLPSGGVAGVGIVKKIRSLLMLLKLVFYSRKIFQKHKVQKVFCVGGYSAAPASIASVVFRKTLFIHEQNAVYGTLNRVLKPFAKEVFCSYDPQSNIKSYPVRQSFFQSARIRDKIETLIFLGGSGGAKAINDFALQVASELLQRGYKVIHQCGKNDFERVKDYYQQNHLEVDCFAFSQELDQKIAQADFAISRSGASALWELVSNQIPTLFVPFPYAIKDHQYLNAEFLEQKGLAFVCRQNELTSELLFEILQRDLSTVSSKLCGQNSIDASREIVQRVLS